METAAKQPDGDVDMKATLSIEESIVRGDFGFFNIRNLLGVLLVDDTTINLVLNGGNMKIPVLDINTRDRVAEWFLEAMKAYAKAWREYDETRLKMQGVALDIQNRMAGAVVK